FESTALLYATELGLRRQRGRLVGMYYSAGGLGGIAGSAVGGAVAQRAGMAPMFMGVVGVMVVTAAVVGRTMPPLPALAPGACRGLGRSRLRRAARRRWRCGWRIEDRGSRIEDRGWRIVLRRSSILHPLSSAGFRLFCFRPVRRRCDTARGRLCGFGSLVCG